MKIKADTRKQIGKKVKRLRLQDKIPAVVYGPKRESENIVLDKKIFTKQFMEIGYNIIAELDIEGEKPSNKVLVKEIQVNPLTSDIIHVSFYQIDIHKDIDVDVPIEIVGISMPVKNGIGFLVTPINSITVTCRADNIPEKLVIDISKLEEVNAAIHIGEIELGNGVKLNSGVSSELVVARVSPPQKELVEEVVPDKSDEDEEGESDESESKEADGDDKKDDSTKE